MQERLDVHGYVLGDELILVPGSQTPDYRVVFELPPERASLSADDETLGRVVLRAAERCRGVVDEVPSQADDMARALGFKSESELRRKSKCIAVSRRHGTPTLDVLPTRKEKGRFVFMKTEIPALIASVEDVGQAIRRAVELSTG